MLRDKPIKPLTRDVVLPLTEAGKLMDRRCHVLFQMLNILIRVEHEIIKADAYLKVLGQVIDRVTIYRHADSP